MGIDAGAVDLVRDTLLITLKIAAPVLAAGVVLGLIISLLQAVTSIQDQTITFVPKIAIMIVVAVIMLPWTVSKLVEFAFEMFRLF